MNIMMLNDKCIKHLFILLLAGVVAMVPQLAGTRPARSITAIQPTESPESVTFRLNGKTDYRVFQVDNREVIIAFNNVRVSNNLIKQRSRAGWMKGFRCWGLPFRPPRRCWTT